MASSVRELLIEKLLCPAVSAPGNVRLVSVGTVAAPPVPMEAPLVRFSVVLPIPAPLSRTPVFMTRSVLRLWVPAASTTVPPPAAARALIAV